MIPSLVIRYCAAQRPTPWWSSRTTPGRLQPATPTTTPPAGQTHTYAVKARNASGLSPLSNTLTATVPEAAEEAQLITARHEDGGNTLVSNLGQTPDDAGVSSSLYRAVQRFMTGANPHGYHVTDSAIPDQVYARPRLPTSLAGCHDPGRRRRPSQWGCPRHQLHRTLRPQQLPDPTPSPRA